MRYKVRASSDHDFRELLSLLQDTHVRLYASSPGRRLLSTGDLPAGVRQQVVDLGGSVSVDRRYDLEHQ
jgi:hypothetical protein